MAGAASPFRGRAVGCFPLALPVGDVSISEGRNKTFFYMFRVLPRPHPGLGREGGTGIIITAFI